MPHSLFNLLMPQAASSNENCNIVVTIKQRDKIKEARASEITKIYEQQRHKYNCTIKLLYFTNKTSVENNCFMSFSRLVVDCHIITYLQIKKHQSAT